MTDSADARSIRLRRGIYLLLAVVSLSQVAANIMRARSERGDTPFLSANDRSRWATIRALADSGVYHLDDVSFLPDGRRNRAWHSIDMVRHPDPSGQWRYYSSKPPLYPTLLAGAYRAAQAVTGANLEQHAIYLGRLLLLLVNLPLLACYLWLLTRVVDELGVTDAGRIFVVAAGALGTFVTTFSTTLNNHTPAALTALATLVLALELVRGKQAWWRFLAAGVLAGLTVANELPALSFAVFLGALLLVWNWRCALTGYASGLALALAASLICNYLAHQSWRPPYMHRSDGPTLGRLGGGELDSELLAGPLSERMRTSLAPLALSLSPQTRLEKSQRADRWNLVDPDPERRWAVVSGADGVFLKRWDDWYDYPGSYWTEGQRQGVDRGEASPPIYALHVVIGHHGLLSLTPVWWLAIWGAACWMRDPRASGAVRALFALIVLTSVACLAFYLTRSQIDRNYGGVSCGFRWLVWCAPLWLACMIPAADRLLERRWGWHVAAALLGASVFSAWHPGFNPWAHPWLYQYWSFLGWI